MSRRARLVLAVLLPLVLFGCTPAMLSALGIAAPVAVAAIDAYTAHAQTIAPGLPATDPLIVALAAALQKDSACHVAVLTPVADAGPSEAALVAQAIQASATATRELALAIATAQAAARPAIDAGSLDAAAVL